ncbi:MAG: 6-carboxytetrahydropterin synthase QueD [Candidatus Omnitrophica bacterium]|nr:6-carboxytetrahydropterin synthase QueD [Candidatus Omnitrophota bacterium]
MFEISVKMDFSAAHNLRKYRGKCEKLHGHNWQVEAVFAAEELDKIGMVMDFKAARKILGEVIMYFDHCYINKTAYFKKVNPTSENIARFIYERLKQELKKQKVKIKKVNIWETPCSRAAFYE